jgi:hypothetical protein
MPKTWHYNVTTTWFLMLCMASFYKNINPSGLKIQPLIRINNL